ncbi:endonuclease/exonuclease/phosphatase family protein [Hyalangium gracile]|uniref:endonuclease/exonuclease/phosphatase family protein n=1 Tax=Hyalangium gracile TaxID=394092 RepID=UPI001CCC7742|nr:endonuclease/exonuclease/phosphatase family protein [Hyalangium gracile]
MKPQALLLRAVLCCALVVPTLAQAGAYLRVVSWNLRHEGWSGEQTYLDDAKQIWNQYGSNSASTNGCDLVFLQEVMDTSVPASIASALTQLSGKTWSVAVTPLLGRSSYKEAYAVLYRTDVVTLLSSSVWSDTGDVFEREPQIVKVRQVATAEDFTFINWHTLFGTEAERAAELAAIHTVFNSVQAGSTSDQDVILLGDHNAPGTSAWWNTFKASVSPAVSCKLDVATTLNTSGGFVNAYDHFWMQSTYVTEFSSAVRDYVASTTDFVTRLSDHAPVNLKLYSSSSTD